MTDIERAIHSCQDRKAAYKKRLAYCSEYSTPKIMRQIELEEIKIAALKEREERNKGCDLCNGRLYTDKPFLVITQMNHVVHTQFNFCPYCGRPLKGNENV